jgi:hypothetical protein
MTFRKHQAASFQNHTYRLSGRTDVSLRIPAESNPMVLLAHVQHLVKE